MTPDEAITAARNGMVVRCIESNGRVVEFANPVEGVWVRAYSREVSHTCSEAAVRNVAGLCEPDVSVVDRRESLFSPEES